MVGDRPLVTFDFAGFDPRRPLWLSDDHGGEPRVLLSDHPEVARLCAAYAREVIGSPRALLRRIVEAARGPARWRRRSPRFGVTVVGYFSRTAGIAEAAHNLVAALGEAGLPTNAVDVEGGGVGGAGPLPVSAGPRASVADVSGSGTEVVGDAEDLPFPVNVVCVNADLLPAFAARVGPDFFAGRYTVGMWAWETEELPASMRRGLDFVDEVWMGSAYSQAAVQRVTDKPVLVFPLPVVAPTVDPTLDRASLGLPPDRFLLLFSSSASTSAAWLGARILSASSTPLLAPSPPGRGRCWS